MNKPKVICSGCLALLLAEIEKKCPKAGPFTVYWHCNHHQALTLASRALQDGPLSWISWSPLDEDGVRKVIVLNGVLGGTLGKALEVGEHSSRLQ